MKIQLIQGQFDTKDALEILSQMIAVKIKFHENRITNTCSEENIKMRENKIKHLQKDLYEAQKFISLTQFLNVESEITLTN